MVKVKANGLWAGWRDIEQGAVKKHKQLPPVLRSNSPWLVRGGAWGVHRIVHCNGTLLDRSGLLFLKLPVVVYHRRRTQTRPHQQRGPKPLPRERRKFSGRSPLLNLQRWLPQISSIAAAMPQAIANDTKPAVAVPGD